jgi:hypothetical protein
MNIPALKDDHADRKLALSPTLQDLPNFFIYLPIVPIIASHGYAPDEYPQPASRDTHQQVQDVIGFLLLIGQIVELVVHDQSLFD